MSTTTDSDADADAQPDHDYEFDPEGEVETIGEKTRIAGTITARSSIHTGANTDAGNKKSIRRQTIYTPDDDKFVDVPVVHGNSVRGQMRRLLITDLLETRLDYTLRDERLYHSLLAGGLLQKDGKAEIDVGLRRQVRTYLPPIDLLGMSHGNQMFEGAAEVKFMYPVCRQLNYRNDTQSDKSIHEFVGDDFGTRVDDEPDDVGLSDVAFDLDADAEDDDGDDQSMQMRYGYETLVAGTTFEHGFALKPWATPVTRSCLLHGIHLWQEDGTVGGMAGIGHGELSFDYDTELSERQRYLAFVDEHADAIVDTLDDLSRK